ncbi:MAG TPA: DUF1801 domain-containing protein [Pedobacter sp.]|nr:DUF1801 domain-containing protein [Pedobacter sp.]
MKTKKPYTIDEYLSDFPKEIRIVLELIRKTVQDAAPQAMEAIKYNMPAFTYKGNLVYFAAFKHHIGFYPAPTNDDNFLKDLSGYKTGKGSIQFPLDKPMPLELIVKIVKWRIAKNEETNS